jgi:hypothetical protein
VKGPPKAKCTPAFVDALIRVPMLKTRAAPRPLKRCAKRERGKALYEKAHALLSHAGIDLLSLWEERSIEEAEVRRRLRVLSLRLFWLTLSCWRRDDG